MEQGTDVKGDVINDAVVRRRRLVGLSIASLLAIAVVPLSLGQDATASVPPTTTETTEPDTTTSTSAPPTTTEVATTTTAEATTTTAAPPTTTEASTTTTAEATTTTERVPASGPAVTRPPTGGTQTATPPRIASTTTPAAADTQEFCNTTPTTVTWTPANVAAVPYPSTIIVDGADAFTSLVTVRLLHVRHNTARDLDVMLVSPTGQNLVLMSDTGGGNGSPTDAHVTLSDSATGPIRDDVRLFTGTYLPTNLDPADAWPAPAPAASNATKLDTFIGSNPNGEWQLFVVDDTEVGAGSIDSWCLTIHSDPLPTTAIAVTSSLNPSPPGADVIVTATVTSGPNPVTRGTVTFREGATILAANVPVSADGKAKFNTDALALGNHVITASFNDPGFLPSTASMTQVVDARVAETFCNTSPIATSGSRTFGVAEPYPSTILVSGAGAFTGQVTVQLGDVTHTQLRDLDVMLVSPSGQSLLLLSDVGGSVPNVTLTFSDLAAGHLPDVSLAGGGTFRPTDWDGPLGDPDDFPAPAPTPSAATTLATFNNENPNGTWSLYVNDDRETAAGTIGGGWCLSLVSDEIRFEETVTAVTSSPNPSPNGADVTFTATVTSDDSPVTAGTASFYNWDTPLAENVPVDDHGQATFVTNALSESHHLIRAEYSGATGFLPSVGGVNHRVARFAGGMWCNNETIAVAESGPDGRANSYPSQITVDGAALSTGQVTVQLGSIIHGFLRDLDILLVSPTGENVVLMSDVASTISGPATVTFADGAPPVPEFHAIESTTYSPTNAQPGDTWPEPAPTASDATALATFNGKNPNGVWSLYVHDDFPGFAGGSLGGGWCLSIIGATTTALTSSANPTEAGENLTLTADVTSGGAPVTTGTVTFRGGATTLAADVPVVDGQATFTTSDLAPGRHELTATFNGTPGLATSTASVTQDVDNATTNPVEGTWCKSGSIAVPGSGTSGSADPYPSRIKVGGAAAHTARVSVELRDLTHEFPVDVDVMLVGPTGENLVLMSDVGAPGVASMTFSDEAAAPLPGFEPLTTGTYLPTNAGSDPDPWPEPAPPASAATRLSTFYGTDPNGVWRLFVVDDAGSDTGSIGSGWCLTIASSEIPATVTALTSSANPSRAGEDVTFAATVTAGDESVADGTVTITDETTDTVLASGLELDADGEATVAVDSLTVGDHEISASYSGATDLGPSDDTLTQRVRVGTSTVLASTPNPSVIGAPVTFTASVTTDDGDPVTSGTVTVIDHTTDTELFQGELDPEGKAIFAIDTLDLGDHEITASYSGTAELIATDGTLTHTVDYAETVALESAPNPSAPGEPVTFAATVTSGGAPVTTGTITFTEGETTLAEEPVDGDGHASFTTDALTLGGHRITATFDAGTGLPGHSATIMHFVATSTTNPEPGKWCNAAPITMPEDGSVTHYPSMISVSGEAPFTEQATIELLGVEQEFPVSLAVLLVSPTGENLLLMGGVGGVEPVADVDLTFSDTATRRITTFEALTTGEYLPSPPELFGGISFPAPAPDASESTTLSTFAGKDPNGFWTLYAFSMPFEGGPFVGSIGDGWCLDITTRSDPTTTTLESTPSPSRLHQQVSFTATVESGDGTPLTGGSVTFRRGRDELGTVDVDEGRATLSTSELAHGVHAITATYDAAPGWANSSSAPLLHLVDANGPEARPTTSPRPNAARWYNRDVAVDWNWLDVDSGIEPADCRSRSATRGQGTITVTATCADRAGNWSTASYTVHVDSVAPTVTVSSPAPRTYWQGTSVPADFTCRDKDSGVVACRGPVADGGRIDTSELGAHRFTVVARDRAGNTRTASVAYTVVPHPTCRGQRATIVGTPGHDVLIGTRGPDVIVTGAGEDWIRARGGDDTICTGPRRDVVSTGPGDDTIDSGAGRDLVLAGSGDDTLLGGAGSDVLGGGRGADTVRGGRGKDNLRGSTGNDSLDGGPGSDTCRGGRGIDRQTACETVLAIP